ncbi:MAG: FAD-binding protein, partial [Lachnospiraceae bacterium]
KTLGGTLACSRKLVERGWFQVDRQVGLSGNAVSAELMITIGVAGSVQFQAGIKQVKKIIAINMDPGAPILGVADTPILADLETLVEELKETICKK